MYVAKPRCNIYRTIGEHHCEMAELDLQECVQVQNHKPTVFTIVKKYYDLQTNRVYIYVLYRNDTEFIKGILECNREETFAAMQPGDISFVLKNEIAIHCNCLL